MEDTNNSKKNTEKINETNDNPKGNIIPFNTENDGSKKRSSLLDSESINQFPDTGEYLKLKDDIRYQYAMMEESKIYNGYLRDICVMLRADLEDGKDRNRISEKDYNEEKENIKEYVQMLKKTRKIDRYFFTQIALEKKAELHLLRMDETAEYRDIDSRETRKIDTKIAILQSKSNDIYAELAKDRFDYEKRVLLQRVDRRDITLMEHAKKQKEIEDKFLDAPSNADLIEMLKEMISRNRNIIKDRNKDVKDDRDDFER